MPSSARGDGEVALPCPSAMRSPTRGSRLIQRLAAGSRGVALCRAPHKEAGMDLRERRRLTIVVTGRPSQEAALATRYRGPATDQQADGPRLAWHWMAVPPTVGRRRAGASLARSSQGGPALLLRCRRALQVLAAIEVCACHLAKQARDSAREQPVTPGRASLGGGAVQRLEAMVLAQTRRPACPNSRATPQEGCPCPQRRPVAPPSTAYRRGWPRQRRLV